MRVRVRVGARREGGRLYGVRGARGRACGEGGNLREGWTFGGGRGPEWGASRRAVVRGEEEVTAAAGGVTGADYDGLPEGTPLALGS